MLALDADLLAIIRKMAMGQAEAIFPLYDLALNDAGDTHYRYAEWTSQVSHDGHTYDPWSVESQLLGIESGDGVPVYTVRFADAARDLLPIVLAHDWLKDASLTVVVYCLGLPAIDYSDLTVTYDVVGPATPTADGSIVMELGGANPHRRRFPPSRFFSSICDGVVFRTDPRCGYTGESIVSVALPSGSPVSVEVTGYAWTASDKVRIESESELTPSLNGVWDITVVDADHFTLDGTDGDDYTGSYTGGALAGFAYCPKTYAGCLARGRQGHGVLFPGLDPQAVRLAGL